MPAVDRVIPAWVDIQALPVPAETFSLLPLVIAVALLIAIFIVIVLLWRRPRYVAQRRIRRLQRRSDTREQLLLLHQALQQGLQVSQLQQASFDPALQHRWQAFCHELMHYRYRPSVPDGKDVDKLVRQAIDWLKRS